MPNEYYEQYKKMLNLNENFKFFTKGIVPTKIGDYTVYRFNTNKSIIDNCIELTKKKMNYTMDISQAGIIRSPDIKFSSQFRGILAETATQILFEKVYGFENVKRWDLERNSFKYSTNEYDLKIILDSKEILCESRSSLSYKTTLGEFIENYHIIGPYVNSYKKEEKGNHIYIRPLFQYTTVDKNAKIITKERQLDVLNDINSKELILYIISGAVYDEMFGIDSEESNNNQGKTKYRMIRVSKAGDMMDFRDKMKKLVS